MKGLFITGTDTDVGKTYVTSLLAQQLQGVGLSVSTRKPVASGCAQGCIDAEILAQATGEDSYVVCPYRFAPAISPERAIRLVGQIITLADCAAVCNNSAHFTLVEGAGGWLSPLCSDGDNADLAQRLALPVLLVASNRLGCINQTRLTLQAIEQRGLTCIAIVLNDTQQHADAENLVDLQARVNVPIFSLGFEENQLPAELLYLLNISC